MEEDRAEPGPQPGANAGWSSLDSLWPVVAFLVFNRWLGLGWAIGAATLGSLWAAYARHRRGLGIGKLLPLVTGIILARGLIGIATDSEAVYFGIGIGLKYAGGLALIIALLFGLNIVARFAPYVFAFPDDVVRHRIYRSTMTHIAVGAGIYYLATATFDLWLFNQTDVNSFVLVRFGVNWILGVAAFAFGFAYAAFRLNKIEGFPGLLALLEAQVAAQQQNRRRPI